jgi:hypothetical protein
MLKSGIWIVERELRLNSCRSINQELFQAGKIYKLKKTQPCREGKGKGKKDFKTKHAVESNLILFHGALFLPITLHILMKNK